MTKLDPETALEDKFMEWAAKMHLWGARMDGPNEFVLSPACSSSYALQVDDDDQLSLGVLRAVAPALLGIKPTNAALLRNHKDGNWLGLNVSNVSLDADDGRNISLRVFFPVDSVKINAFMNAAIKPGKLRLRSMKIQKGKPVLSTGVPGFEIPLLYVGFTDAKPGRKPAGTPNRRPVRA